MRVSVYSLSGLTDLTFIRDYDDLGLLGLGYILLVGMMGCSFHLKRLPQLTLFTGFLQMT